MHHTGKNVWLAPVTFKSKCRINIKYFPFDTQHCKMKFGSWTYDGFRLDVTNESHSADLNSYIESAEWDLVAVPAVRNVVKYFCCVEPFPDVTYTIIIQRRSLFYMMNLILPLVIITVLINVSFVLPAESGKWALVHSSDNCFRPKNHHPGLCGFVVLRDTTSSKPTIECIAYFRETKSILLINYGEKESTESTFARLCICRLIQWNPFFYDMAREQQNHIVQSGYRCKRTPDLTIWRQGNYK